jgi:hypothetical protein
VACSKALSSLLKLMGCATVTNVAMTSNAERKYLFILACVLIEK